MSKALCAADERIYSPKDAIDLLAAWGLRYTVATLATWRCRKDGPQFLKIRGRAFYTEHALRRFASGVLVKTIDAMEE
jgi:hypothetical protein